MSTDMTFLETIKKEVGEVGPFKIRLHNNLEYPPGSGARHRAGETIEVSGPFLAGLILKQWGGFEIVDRALHDRVAAAAAAEGG